jgi:hypothetical protein
MDDDFKTWEKFQHMLAAKNANHAAAAPVEAARLDMADIYKRRAATVARANGQAVEDDEPKRSIFDAIGVADVYRRRATETAAYRFVDREEVLP